MTSKASTVTSPNSSTTPPNSSTPIASSVTRPNSSNTTTPSNPASSVVPPASSSKPTNNNGDIKPLGTSYIDGKCVFVSPKIENDCELTEDLQAEQTKLENSSALSVGDQVRLAQIRAQLALRNRLGNDQLADNIFNDLRSSTMLLGGMQNNGTRAKNGLSQSDQINFWNGLAEDVSSGILTLERLNGLVWFAQNHVMQRDSDGNPYYFRWNPRFGTDTPQVLDLPGGAPFFVNGDPRELNKNLDWRTAGFLQSVFGGWNRNSFRKMASSGLNWTSQGFVGSGCRHPAMAKPTGNMPNSGVAAERIDPTTGKPYSFDINGDLATNIAIAEKHRVGPLDLFGYIATLNWFQGMEGGNRPWDFKSWGSGRGLYPQYENYGNFHYGAIGAAAGIPTVTLHAAAGFYQDGDPSGVQGEKPANKQLVGLGGAASPLAGTRGAFGDDPKDYYWIDLGVEFYTNNCHK